MRKWLFALIVVSSCISSCTDFWSGSTKREFHEACSTEAIKWAGTQERADSYCDCVLKKMMQRYPNENDAFAHLGDLAQDTALINCKTEMMPK